MVSDGAQHAAAAEVGAPTSGGQGSQGGMAEGMQVDGAQAGAGGVAAGAAEAEVPELPEEGVSIHQLWPQLLLALALRGLPSGGRDADE